MEKNYYLDIIKNLEPGVVIFDEDMNVLHLNNLILSYFPGFTKDQVFSKNILDIHSEDSKEKIRDMIRRINETGEQVVSQFKIQSYKPGRQVLFAETYQAIFCQKRKNRCICSWCLM